MQNPLQQLTLQTFGLWASKMLTFWPQKMSLNIGYSWSIVKSSAQIFCPSLEIQLFKGTQSLHFKIYKFPKLPYFLYPNHYFYIWRYFYSPLLCLNMNMEMKGKKEYGLGETFGIEGVQVKLQSLFLWKCEPYLDEHPPQLYTLMGSRFLYYYIDQRR